MCRRLLALLALLLWAGAAHALVPVITGTQYKVSDAGGWFASREEACNAEWALFNGIYHASTDGVEWEFGGIGSNPSNNIGTYCRMRYRSSTGGWQPWMLSGWSTRNSTWCPANSTSVSGGCQCNSGYQENSAHTACEVATPNCTFGNIVSSGFYDYGSQASGNPPTLVCAGGCSAFFEGEVPAGSALVDGTKHYFAKGFYRTTGGKCTEASNGGSTASPPDATTAVPPDSCGANQTPGSITVNGRTTTGCFWDEGKNPEGTDPSQPAPTNDVDKAKTPDTGSKTDESTTQNPDGSSTTTSTTTTNNGNGTTTTTTTTTTTNPDGSKTTSTTTSTDGKQTDEQKQQDKCEKNSSEAGCGGKVKEISAGGLYTKKDKSIGSVLSGAKDTLMASGVGSAVSGFFSVGSGGSCPSISGNVPFLETTVTIDTFCSDFAAGVLLAIRSVLLVLAAFFAFRIAME